MIVLVFGYIGESAPQGPLSLSAFGRWTSLHMKQSRRMSLVESLANVAVGYGVAVVAQILVFPLFGLHATLEQNLQMGAVFTMVSIARSYALRRAFETLKLGIKEQRRHRVSDGQGMV